MPQPTPGDVHVDRFLTDFSVAFYQGQKDFIADKVFPSVPVTQQSNRYRYYPRAAWFRTEAAKRAPSSESRGSGWVTSSDSYFCDVWAVHKDIDDQERANEDDDVSIDTDAVDFITGQGLLRRDLEWRDNFFKTTVWGLDLEGVNDSNDVDDTHFLQFDQASSTPIQFFHDQEIRMQRRTGFRPNTLVLGPECETVLVNHPQIIDRIKYTREGTYDYELLARLLKVDRILTANAVVNTTPEKATELEFNRTTGQAHADADDVDGFEFVFGKHALLCYTAPRPGRRVASAGYTFTWSGLYGTAAYGGRVSRIRSDLTRSDRIEWEAAWDMKVTAPDLGVFLHNLIA